ncbi:2-octaprenyl-6-methoxyphenyl hydroxylase [Morganella psychrotolerans]|uniref:2-octaprenyl-6-methoxyphenyl hydroxylase n=1 Tax=Morganella psychrotolerans TaxID=368603 RepID=A0A5M9RCP6_9GAMM|nr:2-octaprenyl-6-methoxyphenyl hydroxylase [Morganella psychrotolerans]KAA8717866.1 2-octaprenyl-6-methoxyphenyl hydroxylase [Morganella psychrotolerans]OBU07906.1 2-octaprenyl-6-methoxyphenyl hydroxylase [Morganella psychrotolerans]
MSVIIAGGGMTGATLALALSRLSHGRLPVAIAEAKRPDDSHSGFDARAIALAHGTCQRLDKIGLWSYLKPYAAPITRVHVSDQGHTGCVNMAAADYDIDALGQVIELHDAGQALFARLAQAENVTLYCPDTVKSITRTTDAVTVRLNDDRELTGHILIAADGSHSAVAQQCGIQWTDTPYEQVAVIANVMTELDPAGRAFERFTPQGPLAMLPMTQGRSSLVWCHHADMADTVRGWDDETFRRELQKAFGWQLGEILTVGTRHSYPLTLSAAQSQISHRLALVGNASQTLHPIAGQGFNLGMRDVMALAEVISQAFLSQEDIGQYRVLMQYQAAREADRQTTMTLTDGLVRLFSNRCFPLAAGRNLGLMAMEMLPFLRNRLAQQTLGRTQNSVHPTTK